MLINQDQIDTSKYEAIYNDAPMRLGRVLLHKGIISSELLNKAISTKRNEDLAKGTNGKSGRTLAQILVKDFNMEYDLVYREVAELYAFNTFDIVDDEEFELAVENLKKIVNRFDDGIKKQMIASRIIPIRYENDNKDKIILAATDPTLREIPRIAYQCGAKSYDVELISQKNYLCYNQLTVKLSGNTGGE